MANSPSPAVAALLARWPFAAFAISALMLAVAHGFQTFGHLEPCHLCLKQREVYWIALPVSVLAGAATAAPKGETGRRIGVLALALVFAYGAYLAGFHAGAEWKWWPAPQTCSSTGPVKASDLLALMRGAAARAPACDQAAWRLLGLSMAGWNFLVSVALVAVSLASAAYRRGRRG